MRHLDNLDCTTHSFESGEKALEVLEKDSAGIDLLITDLQLPGWLSGPNLVRKFQSTNPSGRALIISDEDWDSEGISVLRKPFGLAQFLDMVEKLLSVG